MSGATDWAVATIQQSDSGPRSNGSNLNGCLVQMSPTCDLRGPRELRPDLTVIGRAEDCDIVLPDASISRMHAEVVRTQEGYKIRDLGSTNGTIVNDSPILSTILRAGDFIRLGNHLLKFLVADDIETQYHETVFSMMTTDALTGTLNKRFLLEVLARDNAHCERSHSQLSFILFDIDHFKQINDRHGHLVGDDILRNLPRRVKDAIRKEDLFARYGGEEFAVALTQTDRSTATSFAERIRATVADSRFETSAGDLPVTISVGVSTLEEIQGADITKLIQRADERLYEAKSRGRNQVVAPTETI